MCVGGCVCVFRMCGGVIILLFMSLCVFWDFDTSFSCVVVGCCVGCSRVSSVWDSTFTSECAFVCVKQVVLHAAVSMLYFFFLLFVFLLSSFYASCETSLKKKTLNFLTLLSQLFCHTLNPLPLKLWRGNLSRDPTPQGVFTGSFMWFFIINLALQATFKTFRRLIEGLL